MKVPTIMKLEFMNIFLISVFQKTMIFVRLGRCLPIDGIATLLLKNMFFYPTYYIIKSYPRSL